MLEDYFFYFKPLYIFDPLTGILKIGEFFSNLGEFLLTKTVIQDIEILVSNVFFGNTVHFYWIFGAGIIFIVIGILIPVKKFFHLNKKQRYLVGFIKSTFTLTVLLYILNEIIFFFPRINEFMDVYLIRLIELFSGFWVLLFVFPFVIIIILVKKSISRIKLIKNIANKRGIKKTIEKKSTKRIANAFLMMSVISLSGIYYTLNYPRTSEWTRYYFTDSQTDVVLFAGNYFNENPLDTENILLVENQGGEYIHFLCALIQVENLEKIYYVFDGNSTHYLNSTDYIEFKGDIEFMNVSYVLFNVKFTDTDFQSNLTSDFNILYSNEDNWTFAKLK